MSDIVPKLDGLFPDTERLWDWAKRTIRYLDKQRAGPDPDVPLYETFAGNTLAAAPTGAELADGQAGVFKRTDTSVVALYYNDGGVIKKVVLT